MRFYVYMAWHPITGDPIYVGKGCGNRISSHNYLAKNNRHYNPSIAEHIRRHGPMEFFKLREGISEAEAIETEKALIYHFGRKGFGSGTLYNRTDGGEGTSGPKTAEWRAKISAALKGKKRSAEQCKRISDAKKGIKNPKQAIWASAKFKGIPKTPEHNAKNSAAQKGRVKSPEECARISAGRRAALAARNGVKLCLHL